MTFDEYVKSLGLDPTAIGPNLQSALEAQWRAAQRPAPAPEPRRAGGASGVAEIEEATAEAEAENARTRAIAALFKKYTNEAPDRVTEFKAVIDTALKAKWTAKETEFELLKMSYGNGPLAFSPSKPQVDDRVLEVAVARAVNVKRETIEAGYDDQTLSAADRQFRGGCGLKRLVVTCARANGMRDADEGAFGGINGTKALLRAAFREAADDWHGAASGGFGPSTYNLSGILSNVMNKSIRDYFMAVEMVWRQITATRPVNDFKSISGYALTGDLTYKKVAPGGEVKHGTLGETSYSNRADLYAIMLGIDYQHIRNDDMGAFDAVNKRLGRGANLTINDVFWNALLTATGSFWSTANGNHAASTDYAFALAGLGKAHQAWQARTDPDGKPMGDRARYLLTASKWELDARKFMRSTSISNDSGAGADNPLAGMWEPLASTYLGNSNVSGYSVDNYFLLCDPANMPVIETVFLDGQEVPTIETAEPDLSRLGIMVRGMHGFGVTRQEPRGGLRLKQTAD